MSATPPPFHLAFPVHDLPAARAALSDAVMIMDERQGSPAASSLEAFANYVRGCARTDLTWDVEQGDASRAAITAAWTCPSRPRAEAMIWTDRTGVVHIQFGMRPMR